MNNDIINCNSNQFNPKLIKNLFQKIFYILSINYNLFDECLKIVTIYYDSFLSPKINYIDVTQFFKREFNNKIEILSFLTTCYIILDEICFSCLKDTLIIFTDCYDFLNNLCDICITDLNSDYLKLNNYLYNYKNILKEKMK